MNIVTNSATQPIHSIVEFMKESLNMRDASKEGNLTIAKLCIFSFIANIWQERNIRIFSNNSRAWQLILKETLAQIKIRAIFLNLDVTPTIAASWDLPEFQ